MVYVAKIMIIIEDTNSLLHLFPHSQCHGELVALFIEDEVMGDVPNAASDGCIGIDGAQFGDVLPYLAAVLLVAALAALIVDDEHGAVRAADDAVGAQVLDAGVPQ